MLEWIVVEISRHLLEPAQWARDRLRPHAGKHVKVDHLAGSMVLGIDEQGFVTMAGSDASPDLVVALTPIAMMKWLTDRKAGWREARVEGDMELAAAVSHVMGNLRWDYEEDLSRVVGDIAAHRIGEGVRRGTAWPATVAQSAAWGMAEFLSEERQVLVTPLKFETFSSEVDAVRDATERLDKRLQRLEQTLAALTPQRS